MRSRLTTLLLTGLAALALAPTEVHADAAGPTDYRTTITSIEPAVSGVQVMVEGGDSFLLLRVDRGITVDVPGYQGEPFLRVLADGTVLENHASATHALSGSRYDTSLPDRFDPAALPDWRTVGTDGSVAWHDHRMHWMTTVRPPGRRPGEVILRSEVPLVVDGVAVVVHTESVWLAAPSSFPVWMGATLGALAALLLLLRRVRLERLRTLGVLTVTVLCLVVGTWQYASLPSETGPRPMWFVLPAVAVLLTLAATLVRSRLTADALVATVGVELLLWGWPRRSGLERALLATDGPAWLDRAVSMSALSAGIVAAAVGLYGLARATWAGS